MIEVHEIRFNILDTNAFKEMDFGKRKTQFWLLVAGGMDDGGIIF